MDRNQVVSTFLFVTLAVILVLESEENVVQDGRSNRAPVSTYRSTRFCGWKMIIQVGAPFDGWFYDNLRCTHENFLRIVETISREWCFVNPPPHHNAYFDIRDKVAVTMHFLTHSGGFTEAADIFGMSKATAIRSFWEVLTVINGRLLPNYVRLPNSSREWQQIADGFSKFGFPNVAGAIDGSLIAIERPRDFFGWYCRKFYPAINFQGVCDFNGRFMSFSMRPGSHSDKLVFSLSKFGQIKHFQIPRGYHWLADAGYTLSNQVLIPYGITDGMPVVQRNYNAIHSSTRMAIEHAFGVLKQRFRTLRVPLAFDSPEANSAVITACVVLHNMLVGDDNFDENAEPLVVRLDPNVELHIQADPVARVREDALRKRDLIAEYLSRNKN